MSETTAKKCFTCLKTDTTKFKDVHAIDSDKTTLLSKLKACVPMLTIEPDTMELCPTCVRQLRAAYKFHMMVIKSQEVLHAEDVTLVMTLDSEDCQMPKPEEVVKLEENTEQIYIETDETFLKDETGETGGETFLKEDETDERTEDEDYCPKGSDDSDNNNDSSNEEEEEEASERAVKKKRCKQKSAERFVELKVECKVCGILFNKNWKLTKHMKRVHNQSRRFECAFCQRVFKQTCHLKEHLASHTGEKNYSCEICDKKFQRLSSVKRHMKGHDAAPGHKTKRTPFLCTICGKSFPFSNGVQRHMRIHLGIRNHQCMVCNRKFTQSTHLQVHMRTHTGEKPYICDTCGEKFSLKACLMKHIHNHHYRKTAEERELDMESMMLYKITTSDLLSISEDGIKEEFKSEFS